MHSELEGAVNIGCPEYVSVDELANAVIEQCREKGAHQTRARPGWGAVAQFQQRAHLLAGLAGKVLS